MLRVVLSPDRFVARIKQEPTLSPRLSTLLQLLTPCETLADIGTDHGYIPLHAVASGVAKRAYGCDINEAPLREAARHLQRAGLEECIEFIHGDGLAALSGRC